MKNKSTVSAKIKAAVKAAICLVAVTLIITTLLYFLPIVVYAYFYNAEINYIAYFGISFGWISVLISMYIFSKIIE